MNLEQSRLIVTGLSVIRSLDSFDDPDDGTLSVEGPNTVRVRAKRKYSDVYVIDKVYTLKQWVYF